MVSYPRIGPATASNGLDHLGPPGFVPLPLKLIPGLGPPTPGTRGAGVVVGNTVTEALTGGAYNPDPITPVGEQLPASVAAGDAVAGTTEAARLSKGHVGAVAKAGKAAGGAIASVASVAGLFTNIQFWKGIGLVLAGVGIIIFAALEFHKMV